MGVLDIVRDLRHPPEAPKLAPAGRGRQPLNFKLSPSDFGRGDLDISPGEIGNKGYSENGTIDLAEIRLCYGELPV